ncbi:hypothetical protein CRUP_007191 [Coryphaenoides rupestris]|nr:hypothetical protein CRUP_007191 [Coryphaenoides rupestris]
MANVVAEVDSSRHSCTENTGHEQQSNVDAIGAGGGGGESSAAVAEEGGYDTARAAPGTEVSIVGSAPSARHRAPGPRGQYPLAPAAPKGCRATERRGHPRSKYVGSALQAPGTGRGQYRWPRPPTPGTEVSTVGLPSQRRVPRSVPSAPPPQCRAPEFQSSYAGLLSQISYKCHRNTTVCAEFNFAADPEAAYIVLNEYVCPTSMACWEFTCHSKLSWVLCDGVGFAAECITGRIITESKHRPAVRDPGSCRR